jgi:Fic family protein
MTGVRGQERTPGEFRRSQNWIGGQGSALKNARYIPPTHEDMRDAMSDLEKYMNSDDELDILIRAGLIHYQFETIHPFLDGNGRIGRLLITLFLMSKGVLKTPALYISYFLKKNRIEYYDRMTEVRRTGNYEQWVKFFLEAVYESAKDAVETIDKLIALHEKNTGIISNFARNIPASMKLLTYIEENPIIEIQKTAAALGIAYNTASKLVGLFCDADILIQNNGKIRKRTFAYDAYLEILRDGTL